LRTNTSSGIKGKNEAFSFKNFLLTFDFQEQLQPLVVVDDARYQFQQQKMCADDQHYLLLHFFYKIQIKAGIMQ
jgi:hypothetical protein